MSISPEGSQPQGPLEALLDSAQDTTPRFSLVRSAYEQSGPRDLLLPRPIQGFNRFLYVPPHLMDNTVYDQLEQAGVPQLPRIVLEDINPLTPSPLFGIREGLKPLAHSALFSRESSATYVSDTEIFTQLGRLYRQAWEATGRIMLDPQNPADSPLDHVAIHNFQDVKETLFLSPPYKFEGRVKGDLGDASLQFTTSLYNELSIRNEGSEDNDYANYLATLIDVANQGFNQGI
jgi:hypothetical protein